MFVASFLHNHQGFPVKYFIPENETLLSRAKNGLVKYILIHNAGVFENVYTGKNKYTPVGRSQRTSKVTHQCHFYGGAAKPLTCAIVITTVV